MKYKVKHLYGAFNEHQEYDLEEIMENFEPVEEHQKKIDKIPLISGVFDSDEQQINYDRLKINELVDAVNTLLERNQ